MWPRASDLELVLVAPPPSIANFSANVLDHIESLPIEGGGATVYNHGGGVTVRVCNGGGWGYIVGS